MNKNLSLVTIVARSELHNANNRNLAAVDMQFLSIMTGTSVKKVK